MLKIQVVLILIILAIFTSCDKDVSLTTQNAAIGQEFTLNKNQCATINYLPENNSDKLDEINICFNRVILDTRGTPKECEDHYLCGDASIEIIFSKQNSVDTLIMGMTSGSAFSRCFQIATHFGFKPSVIDTLGFKFCLLSLTPLTGAKNKEATAKLKVSEL